MANRGEFLIAMTGVVDIPVEPIAAASFAPFGELIAAPKGQPTFSGDRLEAWRVACQIDGTAELLFIRYDHQPMAFTKIEPHFAVTQCFIPLDSSRVVMVVAPPTGRTALP